ncbi:hypothetical protein niasHT_019727 [Heterodera trifolii]|uniref:Major facilitator superfamily (MFS) profile domain-containing protein n=1 Tax=Heterodera trifolii TaxID=157864 RepID=A0ABD2LCA0_9BILA
MNDCRFSSAASSASPSVPPPPPSPASPSSSSVPSLRLSLVALLVGLSGAFHFGIQITITNPSQQTFLLFLNSSLRINYGKRMETKQLEVFWSLIVSMLFLGAIFGSLSIRPLADRFGRLRVLFFSNLLCSFSLFCSAFSYFLNRFELLCLSRFGIGFSLALCLGLAGIFLAECSPKYCRGFVSMSTGALLQLGTVFGSFVAIPRVLGSANLWWVIFTIEGTQLLATTIILTMVAEESPSFLLLRNNETHARHSLAFYHNCSGQILEERMGELRRETLRMSILIWLFHFRIGSVVSLSMAFSGIAVINAFAVELFRTTGVSEYWASIDNVGLALLSLASNIASALLIDRFGRRRLLLVTLTVILLMNFVISGLMYAYAKTELSWLGLCLIVAISLFTVAFAFGPGPICYFLASELVEQNARSAAQGWANLCQMISRAFLLAIFLPLRTSIGVASAYFLLFVMPILVALLFLFFNLPETKRRDICEVRHGMRKLPHLPNKVTKVAVFCGGKSSAQRPKIGWTNIVVNEEEEKKRDK